MNLFNSLNKLQHHQIVFSNGPNQPFRGVNLPISGSEQTAEKYHTLLKTFEKKGGCVHSLDLEDKPSIRLLPANKYP